MEIQIRRHSCDLTRQSLNAFSKLFEEIPTFEEAFDPASLRKFFQEHESTNSQSAYSPHKDISIFEEGHSQGTNEIDSLLSPADNTLSDFQTNCEPRSSRFNFSWNLKLDGKGLNMESNTKKSGLFAGMPFIIKRTSSNQMLDSQVETIRNAFGLQNDNNEVAKNWQGKKQIFKIIRENKSKEVSLNAKRKQSSHISEDLGPVKKVKSYTSSRRYSAEVNSTKLSDFKKSDPAKYGGFQNVLKNF